MGTGLKWGIRVMKKKKEGDVERAEIKKGKKRRL